MKWGEFQAGRMCLRWNGHAFREKNIDSIDLGEKAKLVYNYYLIYPIYHIYREGTIYGSIKITL